MRSCSSRPMRFAAPAARRIAYLLKKPAQKLTARGPRRAGGQVSHGRRCAAAAARRRPRRRGDAAGEAGGGGRGRARRSAARPVAPGLNRVSWDLDYPGATTFPGMVLWGASTNGPAALPGQVPGAADRRRPDADAAAGRAPASVALGDRRRPEGAVRPGDPDPRQGERGEQRRHPDPRDQAAGRRTHCQEVADAAAEGGGGHG